MSASQVVPLTATSPFVRGALSVEQTDGGLTPRRLPAWTRPQLPDIVMDTVVALTAGVRIEMVTDSPEVELDATVTAIALAGQEYQAPAFELVVDGEVAALERANEAAVIRVDATERGSIDFEPGTRSSLRFVLDGSRSAEGGKRHVEIWLPTGASVELNELRVALGATAEPAAGQRRRWVHYGSSISHCAEVSRPFAAWPIEVARRHRFDLTDLALAGQCHLDPFVARTISELPADVITMKVGINVLNGATMRQRTFGPAVEGFLDRVREGHPTTRLVVISPIFCPLVEDRPGPTVSVGIGDIRTYEMPIEASEGVLTAKRIRDLLATIVERRRVGGDLALEYVNGLELFGPADEDLLWDRLHPNEAGYALLGDRFDKAVFA
jgi:lysophospholipase L1-like esterase